MSAPMRAALCADLRAHDPADAREARSLRHTLALLGWLTAPFDQRADPTHVTGSAIVRSDVGKVLLHRHKRLGIWLQPGGHLEAGEPPWDAAVRETHEETGAHAVHPDGTPRLVHVDVHEGPRGHLHLDLRYLLYADDATVLDPAPGESQELAWLDFDAAVARADASLVSALAAADRVHQNNRR